MPQRFLGKKQHIKYVRPFVNSKIAHKITPSVEEVTIPALVEEVVKEEVVIENNINEVKEETVMNNSQIEKIEQVLGNNKAPKRKIKVEKKDKGLFEREEKSTILLTEDNKMVLTD